MQTQAIKAQIKGEVLKSGLLSCLEKTKTILWINTKYHLPDYIPWNKSSLFWDVAVSNHVAILSLTFNTHVPIKTKIKIPLFLRTLGFLNSFSQ